MEALSPPQENVTGFLSLPLELRRKIYSYLLTFHTPITRYKRSVDDWRLSRRGTKDKIKNLLLVSKQVSEEALDVFYGNNTFEVDFNRKGCLLFCQKLTEENRRRIRRLQVLLQPHAYGIADAIVGFSPILSQLAKLSIIAQQPAPFGHHQFWVNIPFDSESDEEEVEVVGTQARAMRQWIKWLNTMMEWMVPQLPSDVRIEVDDNGLKETGEVLEQCLPRFQRVQTWQGDITFSRVRYKSGTWGNLNDEYRYWGQY